MKNAVNQLVHEEVRLLSRRQVAERLGLSVMTIKRWEKRGLLKAKKFNARVVRIPESELKRLMDEADLAIT